MSGPSGDDWKTHGSFQPEPLQRRQSLPLRSEHVARPSGRKVESAHIEPAAGFGVDSVAHSGLGALLQRTRLREVARNTFRQPEFTRLRRQHPPGHGQVGHAGTDPQSDALLQASGAHSLLAQTARNRKAVRGLDCRHGSSS